MRKKIESPFKNYVDNKFIDPSIIKNTAHIDLNDRNITNARFIQVNQMPQIDSHLTLRLYVDYAINDIISYVDNLHEINRNRRDLSSVFNDQDNEIDNNKLTNLDSITVNGDPSSDNEPPCKKYIDDSIGKGTIVRLNETLENYLKVSVGDNT